MSVAATTRQDLRASFSNYGEVTLAAPGADIVSTVTADKRNAIVLAYRHGLSHQEIVSHTQTPLGTVKSWIRRGLEELKLCLTQ